MDRLFLTVASNQYEKEIESYIDEFRENGEYAHGTSGLADAATIEDWLESLEEKKHEESLPEGFVPATVYLAVREKDKEIVGMLQIRHRLNDYLLHIGWTLGFAFAIADVVGNSSFHDSACGHIGYSVRKSERGKGYGKEQLRLALDECRRMGIEKVLITCDKSNIPSAKTIQANGGVLENEILADGKLSQRYWIDLE